MNFKQEYENDLLNLDIEKIDLTKCRLCQQNDGNIEMLSDDTLCQQISVCTGINIRDDTRSEKLPKFVCSSCKNNIDQFITFQENCVKIDEKLKILLEKSKVYPYLIVSSEVVTNENEPGPMKTRSSTNKKFNSKFISKSVCKKCNQPKRAKHKCKINKKSFKSIVNESEIKVENDFLNVSESTQLSIDSIKIDASLENVWEHTELEDIELNKFINDSEQVEEKDGVNIENDFFDTAYYNQDFDSENSEKYSTVEEKKNDSKKSAVYVCPVSNCGKKMISKCGYVKHLEGHDADYNPDLDNASDDDRRPRGARRPLRNVCRFMNCGKRFASRAAYKQHVYNMHDIKEFLCPTCGKSFRRYSALKVHEQIHLPHKEFVCTECNMEFSQHANLKTHIKLHHEGHRFYCTKCGKGFLTNCTLKRHELIHTGVKDFKCDTCPAAFYTRRELTKHQRYHNGIRPHFCSICYRTYVEKHHLTIHMRAHTGERPYACDVNGCGKAFTESQKLRRHKKNVHRLKL